MKYGFLLFLLCVASCTTQESSPSKEKVEPVCMCHSDSIYYHWMDGSWQRRSEKTIIEVNVLDISSLNKHDYINNELVDAVVNRNDTLIVICNNDRLFCEQRYCKESLIQLYPGYRLLDSDEDLVLAQPGDTIRFFRHQNDELSAEDAVITTKEFHIGHLFVGMNRDAIADLLGIKKDVLTTYNQIVVLPNYKFCLTKNSIRHPSVPKMDSSYEWIIISYKDQIESIKVTSTSLSADVSFLTGPDFDQLGVTKWLETTMPSVQ